MDINYFNDLASMTSQDPDSGFWPRRLRNVIHQCPVVQVSTATVYNLENNFLKEKKIWIAKDIKGSSLRTRYSSPVGRQHEHSFNH